MGGRPGAGPIDRTDHRLADWEILADALNQALGAKGIRRTDEMRRVREDMPPEQYLDLSYYERWVYSAEVILIEKGILTREEIDRRHAEVEVKLGAP
jgi:nitrile hydratase